jgi:hypothetical protein
MELNKLDHESVVRTGNRPFLLYKTLRFFVVIPIFENYVSNYEGYRPGNALNAMDEDILLVLMGILDELDNSVKQALDVLVLRVLQEKSQILDSLFLKPVLAVVSCAVYDVLDLVFFEEFRNSLPLSSLTRTSPRLSSCTTIRISISSPSVLQNDL